MMQNGDETLPRRSTAAPVSPTIRLFKNIHVLAKPLNCFCIACVQSLPSMVWPKGVYYNRCLSQFFGPSLHFKQVKMLITIEQHGLF